MENGCKRILASEVKIKLDEPRVESARDIGVILKVGSNGDITTKGNEPLEDKFINIIT